MTWELSHIAKALGGEISGQQVLAPGPGHSPRDRSLAVRPSHYAPDGLLIFSHAGDDWRTCRDYVLNRLGITRHKPSNIRPIKLSSAVSNSDNAEAVRIERAIAIWRQGVEPRGTLVETYLGSRALDLPQELAGEVIRFHAACPWGDKPTGELTRVPAMLALMRHIHSNEATAVQRTALTPAGQKIERRMFGVAGGAAIKLDADCYVTQALTVGEGFETCLAARQLHYKPTWAVGSVAAIASFPLLPGIETLTLLEETGDNGASVRAVQECGTRWHAAGREVIVVTPRGCEGDVNDVLMRWKRREIG